MKRKLLYLGVLASLAFASCSDFLDVDSPSSFEPDYIYDSEAEIFQALSSLYAPLTTDALYSHYMNTSYVMNTDVEFKTGAAVPNTGGTSYESFEPMSNATGNYSSWTEFYNVIDRANNVIYGIENCDIYKNASTTTPSTITQYYGEAKTIRAMMYLDLVRNWGDVPFRLHPANPYEDFAVEATDRNEILSTLIEDLISCEPMMKYAGDVKYGVEQACREYCQGLIARMALVRGGWCLRPDKNKPSEVGYMDRASDWRDYYQIAEEYAGKVISEGKHDLVLSFEKLWKEECNWRTPQSDDIIFDIPLLKSASSEFAYYIGIPVAAPTDENHHDYGNASGSYSMAVTYMISFDLKDLRRDMTCALYSYSNTLNQAIVNPRWNMSVKAAKWCKLYMETPMGSATSKSTGVNNPIMRFADVLLMYAEAANENHNGPTEEAIEALKRVRRRAFNAADWPEMVDAYVDAASTKDEFFELIFHERKWEFGGENIRKYDLARWNLYSKVVYQMYFDHIAIGKEARGLGNGEYDWAPENIYWKSVEDPKNPGRTILDIQGLKPRLFVGPPGYSSQAFSTTFGSMVNKEDPETGDTIQEFELTAGLANAFRGFINLENQDQLDPNNLPPVRYLIPIPAKAILDHKGKLVNYYGFI